MTNLARYNNNYGLDFFDKFLGGIWGDDLWSRPLAPVQDRHTPAVREHDDRFDISLAAPGLEKGDFNISIESNRLTLSYDASDKQDRYAYATKYSKSYTLPSNCDVEKIDASYKNGVLVVSLPKTEAAIARVIKVK